MEPILTTVSETARLLNVSRAKVFVMLQRGELESVKLGNMRRVRVASIKRLAETGTGRAA